MASNCLFVNVARFKMEDDDAEHMSVCDHPEMVSLTATWYTKGCGFSIYFPKGPECIKRIEKLLAFLKGKNCETCGQKIA